ncbi:12130_t:CDS:1, partial [Funneliformis caledonium]
ESDESADEIDDKSANEIKNENLDIIDVDSSNIDKGNNSIVIVVMVMTIIKIM